MKTKMKNLSRVLLMCVVSSSFCASSYSATTTTPKTKEEAPKEEKKNAVDEVDPKLLKHDVHELVILTKGKQLK